MTRKRIEINDLLNGQYPIKKDVRFKTPMLRSDLCDYSNVHIVVKRTMDLLAAAAAANENVKAQKDVTFKNNASFRSRISKYNIIVMSMYNLLEYSDNCFKILGSLWNYHRDKIEGAYDNALEANSFDYKTKTIGRTPARPDADDDDIRENVPCLDVEVTIPLKYLSNFWRSFDLPLISRKVELDLLWTKDCVLIEANNNITGVNFIIVVSVITLTINESIIF